MEKTLLSIGHGYSAKALAKRLLPKGWRIIGTTRSPEKAAALKETGIEAMVWPGGKLPLGEVSHVLTSVSPGSDGDPVLAAQGAEIAGASHLKWVGYLSTTGVYGDHQGDWVDEDTALTPSTERGIARVEAEAAWAALGVPLHIFRLAGIYGPGRGPFSKVRSGNARRIIKEGQVFSRTHVDDIAQVLEASIDRPNPGRAYNVCDDDPAQPQDVIAYAAQLLGMPVPDAVSFEDAELSAMARSFYSESKRVRNDRIKDELGVDLIYPDYRAGLRALLERETSRT
ncbi:MAG: SDR family oxidoreductase [Boseongicola sp.]|nr:SDR family oxidoreductase [Boseongicola sp.]NNJ68094.1 SDR family oxidoreductase [Boseongicola sp.]